MTQISYIAESFGRLDSPSVHDISWWFGEYGFSSFLALLIQNFCLMEIEIGLQHLSEMVCQWLHFLWNRKDAVALILFYSLTAMLSAGKVSSLVLLIIKHYKKIISGNSLTSTGLDDGARIFLQSIYMF